MVESGSTNKTARIAGLLYLVVVVTGIFSLAYVPSKLIVWDDPATTVKRIVSGEMIFRLGILSSVVCYTAFLLLPLVLYKLLRPVNQTYAQLMVILAVVSVPISFINIQHKLTVLSLISDLRLLSADQLGSQVIFYLKLYENGILLTSLFWGLWLFPFGYLVFKSGFLPKFLGVMLMLGCFGYLVNFSGNILYSGYSELGLSSYIRLPASIGEIGTCLWLLVAGVKEK